MVHLRILRPEAGIRPIIEYTVVYKFMVTITNSVLPSFRSRDDGPTLETCFFFNVLLLLRTNIFISAPCQPYTA